MGKNLPGRKHFLIFNFFWPGKEKTSATTTLQQTSLMYAINSHNSPLPMADISLIQVKEHDPQGWEGGSSLTGHYSSLE